MSNQKLTAEQSANLHALLQSIGNVPSAAGFQARVEEGPCDIYKKDVKPVIDEALKWTPLIPEWGADITAVLQAIEKIADSICK